MAAANQIETAASLAVRAIGKPEIITTADGREFLITPESMNQEDISPPNKPDVLMPKLVTQNVTVQTTDSLVTYVNRMKNFDTMLFADISTNRIVAIIDYHKMPGANIYGDGHVETAHSAAAQLNQHVAALNLPYSQEWLIWNKGDEVLMSHRVFASFLEENQIDVVSPPGGDLLELCRDLQVINNVNFSSSVRNGDYATLAFAKESDATSKGEVQLPISITLKIPVYFGEAPVEVTAFMRRKIDDGKLSLGYKLIRAENIRQDEFHRIVGMVGGSVELTTLYGRPA